AGPTATPILAVRDNVDADLLLQLEHFQDFAVFDLSQPFDRQLASLMCRVRILQFLRPKKATDLISPVRP
ncbi:MAG TPA: hypothetical protein VGQ62_06895, partial [Chloroflexota bacterium]|nr:hypothetical protein [Chloroflexota bacterium]